MVRAMDVVLRVSVEAHGGQWLCAPLYPPQSLAASSSPSSSSSCTPRWLLHSRPGGAASAAASRTQPRDHNTTSNSTYEGSPGSHSGSLDEWTIVNTKASDALHKVHPETYLLSTGRPLTCFKVPALNSLPEAMQFVYFWIDSLECFPLQRAEGRGFGHLEKNFVVLLLSVPVPDPAPPV
jgi:hypothetical protein